MMRMVMTSPNVLKNRRPDWLAPYNFFLFPILSGLEGYPVGFDRANFQFITPSESDRKKWNRLKGINLLDGRIYQMSMVPDPKQRKVLPDSFQIILNQYLGKLSSSRSHQMGRRANRRQKDYLAEPRSWHEG